MNPTDGMRRGVRIGKVHPIWEVPQKGPPGEKGVASSFPAWNTRSQHPEHLDICLIPLPHIGDPCARTVYPVSLADCTYAMLVPCVLR